MITSIKEAEDDYMNVDRALGLEWLDTNGIGGYASSSVLNCHTRKYHGLLVARCDTPPGKYVLLSKLDDQLFVGDKQFGLSLHQYSNCKYSPGDNYLHAFTLGVVPTFAYAVDNLKIQKQIALVQGENTVLVKYSALENQIGAQLRIRPLLAFRDFHQLMRENMFLRVRTFPETDGFSISPYDGMPPLHVRFSGGFDFMPSPVWYRNFEYSREEERGFYCREDLFCPGVIELVFPEGHEIVLSFSTTASAEDPGEKWDRELERRQAFHKKLRGTSFQKTLAVSARNFLSESKNGNKAITAGYPWFLEWGRDAMIALPGTLLYNGLTDHYLDVLRTFAAHQRDGLIPNYIGPSPEQNAYNSADASLWFVWALQKYLEKIRKVGSIPSVIWQAVGEIFHHYKEGTSFGIQMLENGLLTVGTPDVQVSWMDAMVHERPVTPRHGAPVEINALWYNLLCFIASRGNQFNKSIADEAHTLASRLKDAFIDAFWIPKEQYLADVVNDGIRDTSIRPNQIFAVSLPFSPLEVDQSRGVVAVVKRELFTPYGLRTLSPTDPRYRGHYRGGPVERDSAYHNGTVWPWLLGHFGEAVLKVAEKKKSAILEFEQALEKLKEHMQEAGLGTVSEVFDGNPPHSAQGCISQAWSVAEILRLTKLIEKEKRKQKKS